ncbi:MAG: FkbM family methyltransferase [Candidatus Nitrosoabyssus spongiisocia]|nr:MAG: FkbM family methyltransferase [Nitrosopumilaceae archaeon AB1(1)]
MSNGVFLRIYGRIIKKVAHSRIASIEPLQNIHKAIVKHSSSDFVMIGENKIYLDQNDSLRLSIHGSHEPFETELLSKWIKESDYVLDLGANIGYFTLIMSKLVGDSGKVFSFEPSMDNFEILKKNIKVNNCNNVIIENMAVGNKNGEIKLYLSDNQSMHTLYENTISTNRSVTVPIIKLDDYYNKKSINKINVIKMDVEGAELDTLRGMSNILTENKDVVLFVEFNPESIKKAGMLPKDQLAFIDDLGFKIYVIYESAQKIKPMNVDQIIDSCVKTTNLLCSRTDIQE